jgi:hypothetical protein
MRGAMHSSDSASPVWLASAQTDDSGRSAALCADRHTAESGVCISALAKRSSCKVTALSQPRNSPSNGSRSLRRCPSTTLGEYPYFLRTTSAAGHVPMIEDISTFAEDLFPVLCKNKAICHPARRDRRGWDYLVEFPEASLPGPPDTHPGSKKAYVQVKSAKKGGRLACRVKLSNALRSAQSDDPWFIVLVVIDVTAETYQIYVTHLWDRLIWKTLKKIRLAYNANAGLHKKTMTISFSDADEHTNHPVAWMQRILDETGSDYKEQKEKLRKAAGYEDGFYGTAEVTFTATLDEVRANFLGLGDGLSLDRLIYNSARFGVLSPEPEVDVNSGILHITPNPFKSCEIWFRAPSTSEWKVLPGQVYSLGLPTLPREEQCLRFSTEFFEMIYAVNAPTECKVDFDGNEKRTLLALEMFTSLMEGANGAPIDAQLWIDGVRIVAFTISLNRPNWNINWKRVSEVMRILSAVASHAQQTEILLSLADIRDAAPDLIILQELLQPPSLRLEFDHPPETPEELTSLIYYFYADVCDYTFYVLVERPVLTDIALDNRRRQLTCGLPTLIQRYVLTNADEKMRKMMREDYEQHVDKRDALGEPAGLGDVHTLLGSRKP